MALAIAHRRDDVDQFEKWQQSSAFLAIDEHPFYGGFGRSYYPLIYGKERQDVSFAVLHDGTPCLMACCTVGLSAIDYYGLPAALFVSSSIPHQLAHRAVALAVNTLRQQYASMILTVGTGVLEIGEASSGFGDVLLASGLRPTSRRTGICDLSLDENALRLAIRKSYRSLVNWGKRTLQPVFVNSGNPDRDAFASYQDFHLKIAGRSTRGQDTWDAMFAWITGGGGELLLYRLESGDLVAGTMVVDGRTASYYASGVYDRERFDKPMGHWPLHNAILRSRERGMKWFDLGEIPDEGTVSAKEFSIGYFKRGFATETRSSLIWSPKTAEVVC